MGTGNYNHGSKAILKNISKTGYILSSNAWLDESTNPPTEIGNSFIISNNSSILTYTPNFLKFKYMKYNRTIVSGANIFAVIDEAESDDLAISIKTTAVTEAEAASFTESNVGDYFFVKDGLMFFDKIPEENEANLIGQAKNRVNDRYINPASGFYGIVNRNDHDGVMGVSFFRLTDITFPDPDNKYMVYDHTTVSGGAVLDAIANFESDDIAVSVKTIAMTRPAVEYLTEISVGDTFYIKNSLSTEYKFTPENEAYLISEAKDISSPYYINPSAEFYGIVNKSMQTGAILGISFFRVIE